MHRAAAANLRRWYVPHMKISCMEKDADESILIYHSHSMKRAGSSTLLVESNAMSSVLAECEWVAPWFGLAKDLHYDLRQRDTLKSGD